MTAAEMGALDAALRYASLGFKVMASAGKKPLFDDWLNKASSDPATIRRWWRANPEANVGIIPDENFAILDIDSYKKGADDTIAQFEHQHGPLPETVSSVTGSGGTHSYYRIEPGRHLRYKIGTGVELLGATQFSVEFPSIHPDTHNPYRWVDGRAPWECEMADAPGWFYADTAEAGRKRNSRAGGGTFFGQVNSLALRRIDDWIEKAIPERQTVKQWSLAGPVG